MSGKDYIPGNSPASFLKRRDPLGAMREFTATEHGRSIGETSGLFEVPRILSRRADQGIIEFEYITDGIELLLALVSGQVA